MHGAGADDDDAVEQIVMRVTSRQREGFPQAECATGLDGRGMDDDSRAERRLRNPLPASQENDGIFELDISTYPYGDI